MAKAKPNLIICVWLNDEVVSLAISFVVRIKHVFSSAVQKSKNILTNTGLRLLVSVRFSNRGDRIANL
jgi:hypothetical protein